MDLAGGLSKLSPPLARMSSMHAAIRLRPGHWPRPEAPRVRQQARISEEALVLAEARYANGETLREIVQDLGVSRQRLASLLRARGVRLRRTTPSSKEVKEMTRRYAEGESLERVGTRLGYSAGTVRNYLLAEGARLRDSHGRGQ